MTHFVLDVPTEKRCTRCGEVKPRGEFYRNHGNRDGLQSRCKTCEKRRDTGRTHHSERRARVPMTRLDEFEVQRAEARRLAALVHDTPSAREHRGVTGGPLIAGYVVMLLPANRTEQTWWQDLVEPFRDRGLGLSVRFVRGRLRFEREGRAIVGHAGGRNAGVVQPPFGNVLIFFTRPWRVRMEAA